VKISTRFLELIKMLLIKTSKKLIENCHLNTILIRTPITKNKLKKFLKKYLLLTVFYLIQKKGRITINLVEITLLMEDTLKEVAAVISTHNSEVISITLTCNPQMKYSKTFSGVRIHLLDFSMITTTIFLVLMGLEIWEDLEISELCIAVLMIHSVRWAECRWVVAEENKIIPENKIMEWPIWVLVVPLADLTMTTFLEEVLVVEAWAISLASSRAVSAAWVEEWENQCNNRL